MIVNSLMIMENVLRHELNPDQMLCMQVQKNKTMHMMKHSVSNH